MVAYSHALREKILSEVSSLSGQLQAAKQGKLREAVEQCGLVGHGGSRSAREKSTGNLRVGERGGWIVLGWLRSATDPLLFMN